MADKTKGNETVEESESWLWEDWNFDSVPDEEVIACCLWEYARESQTIKMGADMHWCVVKDICRRNEYKRNPASKAEDDQEAKRIEARVRTAGFDYEAFRTDLWKTDFHLIEIYDSILEYVRDEARSWLTLSTAVRSYLVNRISERSFLAPMRQAMVGELEQIWNAHRSDLEEVRALNLPADDDSEMAASYTPTEPLDFPDEESKESSKTVGAAFVIDFSRYNDQEIADSFRNWLLKHRPGRWAKPKRVFPNSPRKGKKLLEYRVALERLGLMRLLHWHTPTELRRDLPEAWNKYGQKQRYFRREVRAARAFFHKLFPFLPNNEVPDSEDRKGVWLPPL